MPRPAPAPKTKAPVTAKKVAKAPVKTAPPKKAAPKAATKTAAKAAAKTSPKAPKTKKATPKTAPPKTKKVEEEEEEPESVDPELVEDVMDISEEDSAALDVLMLDSTDLPDSVRDLIDEVAEVYREDPTLYAVAREAAQEAVLRLIEDAEILAEHAGRDEIVDEDLAAALQTSDRRALTGAPAPVAPAKKKQAAPKKKAAPKKTAPAKKTAPKKTK